MIISDLYKRVEPTPMDILLLLNGSYPLEQIPLHILLSQYKFAKTFGVSNDKEQAALERLEQTLGSLGILKDI